MICLYNKLYVKEDDEKISIQEERAKTKVWINTLVNLYKS